MATTCTIEVAEIEAEQFLREWCPLNQFTRGEPGEGGEVDGS